MADQPHELTTPDPVVRVDPQRLRAWWSDNRARLLNTIVALVGAVAVGIPMFGWSDELLAFAGERLFGVGELPAVVAPDERTTVVDAEGNVIGHVTGAENRRSIALEEVPANVRKAIIATEDTSFWRHEGVDVGGILRAAVVNVTNLGVRQGGSTITQQYVKNALLTSERSFRRKITEATWAVRLEQRLPKEEILERYLNLVYLGDGNYGVAAAAEYWFGAKVQELDLSQAALLAAMIKAPETLDPVRNPEEAGAARDRVIDRLRELDWISQQEADEARAVILANQLDVTPLPRPEKPFFVDVVTRTLLDDPRLGEDREARKQALFGGGLVIETTLQPARQRAADDVASAAVTDPAGHPLVGIVSVKPGDGAVEAMALAPKAFGPCPDEGPCLTTTVNPLVPGMGSPGRQVGSAIKPIVVAAALEAGLAPDWHTDTRSGERIDACGDYAPENYGGTSAGTIDMLQAMVSSNNVFHVKLGVATGLDRVVETAADLGIHGLPPYCSVSLGSVEQHPVTMASAYAAFAAGGLRCEPYWVREVRDRSGNVLLRNEPRCEQVVSPETAEVVTTLLQHNATSGTATRADVGRPFAAKTGTTNDYRDAWLVGFTPELATAVWIGYEEPAPMRGIFGVRNVTGGSVPAQLWGAYMQAALAGTEPAGLPLLELPRFTCRDGEDADSYLEGRQDGCGGDEDDDRRKRRGKGKKRKATSSYDPGD